MMDLNLNLIVSANQWLNAKEMYLQCVSNGVTSLLHWAIEITKHLLLGHEQIQYKLMYVFAIIEFKFLLLDDVIQNDW